MDSSRSIFSNLSEDAGADSVGGDTGEVSSSSRMLPVRRWAGKRCPPPSPNKEGLRILVRAVRRKICPGNGTMIGWSTFGSSSLSTSTEAVRISNVATAENSLTSLW